jgi:hypothetical protein
MKSEGDKQIHDWQEKVRSHYGESAKLYQYLFETMDNFYYRYLETSLNQNIKTQELEPSIWGAITFESNMTLALKVQTQSTKAIIMELAKSIPKSQGPQVRYSLKTRVKELTAERGDLAFEAEVFGLKSLKKEVIFKYDDLAQFRKELALKLEEACEIFL